MTKLKVGSKVKITSDPFAERTGRIIAIAKDNRRKEYIVQFAKSWSYFSRKELKEVKR